ncbi:hypothetical protein SAMN04489798_4388 [Pseudomonas arsenicoxydans]|uniref:Uncharacterized protein n=1 Tax=Pseudomonas arsenicoxydans TaxID=702115 RepID=A0A1H0P1Q1_9PSED|nr:hypothetical protein [Pseudomonas arsenicoxydans]SDO98922.1 hypothetical protein SAMN04489798_4388 [Pseudomonas arsenicoxydans]
MLQLNWPAWVARVNSTKGKWALERWLLMYLHEQQNVDRLALAIMEHLMAGGQNIQVRVQSIWVDGTPQAAFSPKGHLPHEERPQCELADLLVCVRLESSNGQLQRERAMLIQAKVASDYDQLPGGESTKKERLLFEDCDRQQSITLYPGVKRENPIGEYQLDTGSGKQVYGLHDCARFLLMAKERWENVDQAFAPLQVGWPFFSGKKQIYPPESFLDAVIGMVSGIAPKLGRDIDIGTATSDCAWTKMVNDLQGKYLPVTMNGYDRQPRVTTSTDSVKSPYLIFSTMYESQTVNFRTNDQWREWCLLSVPFLRHRSVFSRLKERFKFLFFRKSRWGMEEELEYLRTSGYESRAGLKLWNDHPNNPPPADSEMNDGNGPHIPILVVTIRGLETDRRSD